MSGYIGRSSDSAHSYRASVEVRLEKALEIIVQRQVFPDLLGEFQKSVERGDGSEDKRPLFRVEGVEQSNCFVCLATVIGLDEFGEDVIGKRRGKAGYNTEDGFVVTALIDYPAVAGIAVCGIGIGGRTVSGNLSEIDGGSTHIR